MRRKRHEPFLPQLCPHRYSFHKNQSPIGSVERKSDPIELFLLSQQKQQQKRLNASKVLRSKRCKTNPHISTFLNQLRAVSQDAKAAVSEIFEMRNKQVKAIDTAIESLSQSIKVRNSTQQNKASCQVYLPVPYPVPMINPEQQQWVKNNDTSPGKSNQIGFASYRKSRNFFMRESSSHSLAIRQKKRGGKVLLQLWRKASNAILFIIYLKRFNKLCQEKRLRNFEKICIEFPKSRSLIVEKMVDSLIPFLELLDKKCQNENGQLKALSSGRSGAMKSEETRKMCRNILEKIHEYCVKQQPQVLIETVYYTCKHGNYSLREPILSKQQASLVCVSEPFGYISADQHLQKSAILGLVLIRLLVFRVLMTPEAIPARYNYKALRLNLYILSSVLYELLLDIQDEEYLVKVPSVYRIGDSVSQISTGQSMICKGAIHKQGQLISGLRPTKWVKEHFDIGNWRVQRRLVSEVVDALWQRLFQKHREQTQPLK